LIIVLKGFKHKRLRNGCPAGHCVLMKYLLVYYFPRLRLASLGDVVLHSHRWAAWPFKHSKHLWCVLLRAVWLDWKMRMRRRL